MIEAVKFMKLELVGVVLEGLFLRVSSFIPSSGSIGIIVESRVSSQNHRSQNFKNRNSNPGDSVNRKP